jgi:uridine phosphorylase
VSLEPQACEVVTPRADIIQPRRGKRSPRLGPTAVLAATEPDLALLASHEPMSQYVLQRVFTSRLYGGGEAGVTLVGPAIGAPYAAMLLETLVAWGVRRLVFIGWCGAITTGIPIGSAVVPQSGVIDEGTSRHYASDASVSRPSPALSARLMDACAAADIPVFSGGVWTTDAVFRENPEKVERYRARGAVAVDMEASALFTVAAFLGVEAAALLLVSDDLSGLTWRPGFALPQFKRTREAACRAVADLAPRL